MEHVCGAQGYNPMKGDYCPACSNGKLGATANVTTGNGGFTTQQGVTITDWSRGYVAIGGGGGGGSRYPTQEEWLATDASTVTVTIGNLESVTEAAKSERTRIATLLATFRDDNPSQRRDVELQRIARNKLLDELGKWLDGGAVEYAPKD